ncbi:hypothetical protein [Kurthia massiliensis]|uniref:hypothetical protein n=1 Tax=Kurthia massiliensis TaxID=1033739 RepID=UPI00028968F7|nr:hypothetical protein [Kurthia massiliensis]
MKKIITLTLSAAIATSVVEVPVASAETAVATTASAYMPMQLLEVKDGQFDKNGYAYFKLNIPQEGFYRLVGNKTKQYETAVTMSEATLKIEPVQAASKLRTLKKGTYYVKVKGTPNATYHFKFAERTFDMDQVWSVSTRPQNNQIDFPYYTERKTSAKIQLTDDKHIRFINHTVEKADAVKALKLRNIDNGKIYTAKKLSEYTFSSNAPNGTYEVSLVLTDAFIKNPYVGKMKIRYELSEHLPLNSTVASTSLESASYTFNLKKDTKIQFTLMDPKGKKGNNQRFSLYDDQHRLIKRVHIQPDQSSRSFTYTVKKGRYSVTLSHNVELNTLIVNGSDTNSAFKLKNNSLVYKATGKVVKGYQVYKEKLYKDGKLTTGRIKYGKVPNMKLYRNGVLEKGIYISKGYKYAFKDGSLIQGDYEYEDETGLRTNALFKNGVLTHLLELKNGATRLYDNGSLHKGRYVFNMYDGLGSRSNIDLRLFINGKLATGYEKLRITMKRICLKTVKFVKANGFIMTAKYTEVESQKVAMSK